MRFKPSVLKDDGGPNFTPLGNPSTQDVDIEE